MKNDIFEKKILIKQYFLMKKKTIKLKIFHEKTSKTEKWKNRKIKNKKIYIFGKTPYVKYGIFQKKYFCKNKIFNEKITTKFTFLLETLCKKRHF